ncbi:MAG TPA: hypothetical protein VMU80_17925 [Bryobacteraceae bacterium]|nr:hypothetical protein [Bryobacteraceae bacterium]
MRADASVPPQGRSARLVEKSPALMPAANPLRLAVSLDGVASQTINFWVQQ